MYSEKSFNDTSAIQLQAPRHYDTIYMLQETGGKKIQGALHVLCVVLKSKEES